MYYSNGLEHIVGSNYSHSLYSNAYYFSKNTEDNYQFAERNLMRIEPVYTGKAPKTQYPNQQQYPSIHYDGQHLFNPEILLKPSRQKARFVDDNNEAKSIAEEIFELMMKAPLPRDISISILPFDDFKMLHSRFGAWSSGILGFSLNGNHKKILVRENHLDSLMMVIGHEIGHVLTETLPNKHDEEAKAFAFSIEWARTIKKHNVSDLGSGIKGNLDFEPARNGLHDIAFGFVDFMVKKGKRAMQLHDDLAKGYMSVFNTFYYPR
jgi:hypothetical protein